ncbi:MAG: hypothetical protein ACTSXK_11765 [Promethearchaeota archaeon]
MGINFEEKEKQVRLEEKNRKKTEKKQKKIERLLRWSNFTGIVAFLRMLIVAIIIIGGIIIGLLSIQG